MGYNTAMKKDTYVKRKCGLRRALSLGLAALALLSLLSGCGKKKADDAQAASTEIDGGMDASVQEAPDAVVTESAPPEAPQATPAPVYASDEERRFYEAYDLIFGTQTAPADYAKAVKLMRPLADNGYPDAQYYMGYMYEYGYGVTQDDAVSLDWYIKAASSGSTRSMINLGLMYEYGDGVEQNYATALAWYKAAANAGDARAATSIGWLYQNGKGVEQDDATAFAWYLMGANAGIPTAMRFTGWMYYYGKGVAQSSESAKYWLQMAVDNGDTAGTYLLEAIYSGMSEVGN